MHFKIQLVIDNDQGEITTEDVIHLDRQDGQGSMIGLSLIESKQLLKSLQRKIVLCQSQAYCDAQNTVHVVRVNGE